MVALSRTWSPFLPYFKTTVSNFGLKIDINFKLNQQINSVVKISFYQALSKIKSVFTFSDFESVIQTFISYMFG